MVEEVGGGFKKSDLPFTFQGDRGGAAEDAALLAELKAISSSSRINSPVASTQIEESQKEIPVNSISSSKSVLMTSKPLGSESLLPSESSNMAGVNENADELIVTRENLTDCLKDRSWKVRKQSYLYLNQLLAEKVEENKDSGSIEADTILLNLDDMVLEMVCDSNASALDLGLRFALDYAEKCSNPKCAEQAKQLTYALFKGNGLASSRATTLKVASSLALKLMEVGNNSADSVHSVVEVLLEKGLTSRKPKVVISTTSLILNACLDFGVACMPLGAIKNSIPTMVQHANASVRETALKIIAEFCRTLCTKGPFQDVIDNMKPAQISQLDKFLEMQPTALAPRVGLRNSTQSNSNGDALAALTAQAKVLEAERFANRPAVNIFAKLSATDYSEKLLLPKWSEKVAALEILLECGGEQPYKLEQPSSSVNYAPIIGDMKKLLGHTHFAVASKAIQVLSMLAEGVGLKLFPYLRPFLTNLLLLSKDKKLIKAVSSCIDVFFGNILSFDHLLSKEDSLSSLLNERIQKNATVRLSCLQYAIRCVERRDTAGNRAKLSAENVKALGEIASDKLADIDSNVRKCALDVFKTLVTIEDEELKPSVEKLVEELKGSNARAHKSLIASHSTSEQVDSLKKKKAGVPRKESGPEKPEPSPLRAKPNAVKVEHQANTEMVCEGPNVEESITYLQSLNIEKWSAPEDDGGILAGLKSSKWLLRQSAIKAICTFCKDFETLPDEKLSSATLVIVKGHSKGFKDSNVNIMKSILELFAVLCKLHEKSATKFPDWACREGVKIGTEKIADRKLGSGACLLLTEICVVQFPALVFETSFVTLNNIKAPLVHEAYLTWFKNFLVEFGAQPLVPVLSPSVQFLLLESESSNIKVRKAATFAFGEFHRQLGPYFRSLALSMSTNPSKPLLNEIFESHPHDIAEKEKERRRQSVVCSSVGSSGNIGTENLDIGIEIPRTNLFDIIGMDCLKKMGTKEGKTAWKLRKEAMDEVISAMQSCSGMLASAKPSEMKSLLNLLRALNERLSDSQSNLKPVSARVIGSVLGAVDKVAQGKLCRAVLPSLVNAAMMDNRKPMRDASLSAIKMATTTHELEASKPNPLSLEGLLIALVGCLSESEYKAIGIPDVLLFFASIVEYLPNIDSLSTGRAQSLGQKFANVMVDCLTSSKTEIRSAAEQVITSCVEEDKISANTLQKGLQHLKPAQQRSIAPIIRKAFGGGKSSLPEKENLILKNNKASESSAKRVGREISRSGPSSRGHLFSGSNTASQKNLSGAKESAKCPEPVSKPSETLHPLAPSNNSSRVRRQINMNWVEFPEEPSGTMLTNSLQKAWSQMLSKDSLATLFPSRGIKKQDDARDGCKLISCAIEFERHNDGVHLLEQLDFVLKWSVLGLCSRENTVGLQSLLSMLSSLVDYLGEQSYTFSDDQALYLVPYIMEKASVAKGRFRDSFDSILSKMKSLNVITKKTMGAAVSVSLIEKSSNAKARVLAYHECSAAVEIVGLSGIGKRGLLISTKMTAKETIPENRSGALDLIMTVLSKLEGDIERLSSICGTTCMSNKARDLIEERWQKQGIGNASSFSTTTTQGVAVERTGRRPNTPKAKPSSNSPSKVLDDILDCNVATPPSDRKLDQKETEEKSEVLPSLGPFTFLLDSTSNSPASESQTSNTISVSTSSARYDTYHDNDTEPVSPTSGAASLRARLQKLRQKQISDTTRSDRAVLHSKESQKDGHNFLEKEDLQHQAEGASTTTAPLNEDQYQLDLATFKSVLSMSSNLSEHDPVAQSCIAALKRFHAVTSERESKSSTYVALRESIKNDVTNVVEHLTGIIKVSFHHGDPEQNCGMCVPLLSVVLATLMSLFKDMNLVLSVSKDALVVLINETGRCLLDSRLAVTATHVSGLDESTSSQMVRGMNKVCTGSLQMIISKRLSHCNRTLSWQCRQQQVRNIISQYKHS